MGRRSRRRDPAGPPPAPGPRAPRVRGEAAEAQVRERLEPLTPGQTPKAVKIAAAIAAIIAVANPILFAAGYELRNEEASLPGVAVLSVVMAAAALFMWRGAYWAVLGFQALLAFTCISAGLALLVASNLEAGIRSSLVLLGAGTLFWFLVRAMARIQMPQRPDKDKVTRHG